MSLSQIYLEKEFLEVASFLLKSSQYFSIFNGILNHVELAAWILILKKSKFVDTLRQLTRLLYPVLILPYSNNSIEFL